MVFWKLHLSSLRCRQYFPDHIACRVRINEMVLQDCLHSIFFHYCLLDRFYINSSEMPSVFMAEVRVEFE